MRLTEGFVVGGAYRVVRLLAAGSKFRVYEADTDAEGPGSVVIKVARHDDLRSLAGLEAGRARVHDEWEIQKRLHEEATSAAPLPLELVRMYPGDPEVRKVALLDKSLVCEEPYLVSEMADGQPLSALLSRETLDEDRALLIALRVVLLIRASRKLGIELRDLAPSNFIVDTAGENVSIVGFGSSEQPEDWHDYSDAKQGQPLWRASSTSLPLGFGRLLVGLLAGMAAPEWGNTDEDLPRWERLMTSRRVPPEYARLVLGTLGYFSRFEGTIDAVENRIRGLIGSPHPTVHQHPARARDSPYLIANKERLGRFEVTKPLGQGGRGFVYRAVDRVSKVEVLIKTNKYIYDSGSAFATELATRRLELEHEFEVLKRFSSQTGMLPQPVALIRGQARGAWFDLAPDLARNEPYVVMEYIKGMPLVDLLPSPFEGYAGATDPRNRLPARFVCRLVAQIADLLSRFHEQGFLYQDLKPENVLYDPRAENVYMVDFAGACPRLPNGRLDKEHVAFGVQTHGFAAPEFSDFWEECDDRFDIYSLGATAYHLATGVNPERVAMESGEEYPALSRSLLNMLEPPLAALILGCIAPLPDRFPSAEVVRDTAELARLQLSRTRPLDVRQPSLEYTQEGVALEWSLPADPRVTTIRVRRYGEGADEAPVTVYSGERVTHVVDTSPSSDDQCYLIETGYERAGKVKHSRGQIVRSEATPAPVHFQVEPYFEGNRLRIVAAPQATDVAIRWSSEAPPVDLTEGEELACGEDSVFHEVAAGTTVHYAGFALYEDVVSAPRFGTATAVGAAQDIGAVEVRQTSIGVVIEWESQSSSVLVHAVRGSESLRIPVPPNATKVVDLMPLPNERLRYVVCLTKDGVVSDPVAEVSVHRWPETPAVELEVGAGRVRLVSPADLHSRFSAFRVTAAAGDKELLTADVERDALQGGYSIDIPGDHLVSVSLTALVDGSDCGPVFRHEVIAPPRDGQLELDFGNREIPLTAVAWIPAAAVNWTGVYQWEITGDDRVLEVGQGELSGLVNVSERGVALVFASDPVPTAGETVRYQAQLLTMTGEVVCSAVAEVQALERLPPPKVEALLGAVCVQPAPDGSVPRIDVQFTRGSTVAQNDGVSPPFQIDLSPGEWVEVAWRRSVSGEPMPWSESVAIEALARPPAPSDPGSSLVDSMVTLGWGPIDLPDTQYIVRDASPGGPTLYIGPFAQFRDVSGRGVKSYAVASLRNGLESDPVIVDAPSGAVVETTAALVRANPQRRIRGLLPSADGLAQCVRVGRRGVAEIHGAARGRVVAVLEASSEAQLDRSVGQLHGTDWQQAEGLVALAVLFGRRGLVPWRGGRHLVRVLEAPLELQRPDWRMIAASVEPEEGTLVGVTESDGKGLVLTPAEGSLRLSDSDALLFYNRDGSLSRSSFSGPAVTALADGTLRLTALGSRLDAAGGLGLATASPKILVPATHSPWKSTFEELLWQDAVRGFPFLVAHRLEAEWRSPIASMSPGNPLVLNYLQAASPVELCIRCTLLNARGRARLSLSIADVRDRSSSEFRFNLSKPLSLFRVVNRAVKWALQENSQLSKSPTTLTSLI